MRGSDTTTVDELRRQARRCRWRRNGVTAQIVGYGTAAVLLAGAAVLVPVALVASPSRFGVAVAAVVLVGISIEVSLLRWAARVWVRRRATTAWVDAEAGLGGRLTTMLALDGGAGLLLPLLRAHNEERRAGWVPERLVPTPFPPLALGVLLAAATLFMAMLGWAPALAPAPVMLHDTRRAAVEEEPPLDLDGVAHRLFATAGGPASGGGTPGDPSGASAGGDGSDHHAVDRLASWQARIRRQMWGERWKPGESGVRADASRGGTRRDAVAARTRGGAAGAADEASPMAEPSADEATATAAATAAGGIGAGTGVDAELFGEAADDAASGGRFALGLTARVFGTHAGAEPPSGPAPASDDDAQPVAAARPRPEEPFHATVVPAAYGAVVRAMFAHGSTTP